MSRHAWCLSGLLALAAAAGAGAADLAKVERRVAKEPAYRSKSPRYALLVLGPGAKDRVWLVKDGGALYVDRNGNGDLTEPGEKVAARKRGSAEEGYEFEAGDLTLSGKTHHNLRVAVNPVKRWMFGENAKRPDLQAAIKADPAAETLIVSLDVAAPHLKAKGLVTVLAGPFDLNGPLLMAAKPTHAPVIHCAGPLEVTFYASRPTLRRDRATEVIAVAGTPGLGAGTFAMIGYDQTIPAAAHPKMEVTFPPAKAGSPPVKKLFELKERC
jgi:hypothetical protein